MTEEQARPAKFVQITFGASCCGADLYALDESGRVWKQQTRPSPEGGIATHWTAFGEGRYDAFAESPMVPSSTQEEQ